MDNRRWLSILTEKKKLDSGRVVDPVDESLPAYLVEGINVETSADESLFVYDCSSISETDEFCYQKVLGLITKHNDPYPVVVFKNWEHERQIYWNHYDSLKTAAERKSFSAWYDKKLSIYVEGDSKVVLEADDRGINYLEYPVKDDIHKSGLHGRVYNISFFELKKLFNVTGAHLFIKNVRYGLRRNSTGETLRTKFREYLGVALYKKALELKFSGELLEALKETLDIDAESIPYLEQLLDESTTPDIDGGFLLPENFWFYHNGISIFSYEEILATPANQIILSPDKVSVINGAQTLTNFFLEVESTERILTPLLEGQDVSSKTVINSIIKTIFVKTIIIYGNDIFVRPITHGLNTQIPILEESLLADSELSDEINRQLAAFSDCSSRIRILKDGELWTGDCGVSVLDFVKHWLTIHDKPGKSKNLGKKQLEDMLSAINRELKTETTSIKKMDYLFQIHQWWDSAREQRIDAHIGDEEAVTIGKYGRNYFGSYVLHVIDNSAEDICLDDAFFSIVYERFLKDLRTAGVSSEIPIVLGTFKRDALSEQLFRAQETYHTENSEIKGTFPETIEEDLRALLNQNGQNAYSFSKTIADYLIEHEAGIDYFRVISRTGGKCKEAFPFPNSTFTEIVDSFSAERPAETAATPQVKAFSESAFAKSVERTFPVFVLDKDEKDLRHMVSRIHLIQEFSFRKFKSDAEAVYKQTIEAFELGDESKLPRSGDKLRFHVRPKAVNAEDTFQFPNGNLITKRTFWANKDAVESLINDALKAAE